MHPLLTYFQYPQNLSYDNYIVGFMHNPVLPDDYHNGGVNIIMSNGDRSNLPLYRQEGGKEWTEVRINPVGAVVKRVVMRGLGTGEFFGVQFYDKNGTLILKAGDM